MKALGFYIAYPILYLISILPFCLFYLLSDAVFVIVYYVFGYRINVVRGNLKNAFPEKTETEIKQIEKRFYRFFCDFILETIKTMSMDEKVSAKRCAFNNPELVEKLCRERGSIILVMGHYGNWEWAGPGFMLHSNAQTLAVIYKPLTNPYFERMTVKMRTRFGTKILIMKNVIRDLITLKNEKIALTILADQTPSNANQAIWLNFLNQETPVFEGTEKIAKKFNFPVVFINVTRPKRGYYEIFAELLVDHPNDMTDGEITKLHTERLEKEIIKTPELWLWSHNRWKHKKIN